MKDQQKRVYFLLKKTFFFLQTEVLKLMLSEDPSQRPTASGVRARAPLYQATDEKWHFTLPSLAGSSEGQRQNSF